MMTSSLEHLFEWEDQQMSQIWAVLYLCAQRAFHCISAISIQITHFVYNDFHPSPCIQFNLRQCVVHSLWRCYARCGLARTCTYTRHDWLFARTTDFVYMRPLFPCPLIKLLAPSKNELRNKIHLIEWNDAALAYNNCNRREFEMH